ncbi:surface antigen (D15) [Anopheles sinensis]|uniref:Surface antigen (D15) n=1 Tax=Anopheles sinensis TaxID=74873 RepID=A0A084VKS8_ANOSI|nr:surface antigen (D15) [Anopheles sinensis]
MSQRAAYGSERCTVAERLILHWFISIATEAIRWENTIFNLERTYRMRSIDPFKIGFANERLGIEFGC